MGSFKQYLVEKLILYNNGASYGQVLFLAGGAASGKGFSRESFMENHKFKIRDVDEWKAAFLKINRLKGKYAQLDNLNLKNPSDVFKLHSFVKKAGIKDKSLDLILDNNKNPEVLPNIMFDITAKERSDIDTVIPSLLEAGYKKENIHITWILADYHISIRDNQQRARVVPDDIMLETHEGAADTMHEILNGKVPKGVNGDIKVVLNNRDQTITYGKSVNSAAGKESIKGFTYITVKKSGHPLDNSSHIKEKLYSWIVNNIPKSSKLRHIFGHDPQHKMVKGTSNDNKRPETSPMEQPHHVDSGLVSIHRRVGPKIGFAFKLKGGRIGFTPHEAMEKVKNLKTTFPDDEFVTIPYNPQKKHKWG